MVKTQQSSSNIVRYKKEFSWHTVKTEPYKDKSEDWLQIKRKILVGTPDRCSSMHLRYFEINKGGYSSLEFHKHEHIVICIRGKGKVRLDNKIRTIKPLDVILVSSNSIHQFYNPFDEPFGFFCIVQAKRDRPKRVTKGVKGKQKGFYCDMP